MSRRYPSAAGADPEAVARAVVKRQVNRREEVPLEDYEALRRAFERAEGEERERLKRRLFQTAGLPA